MWSVSLHCYKVISARLSSAYLMSTAISVYYLFFLTRTLVFVDKKIRQPFCVSPQLIRYNRLRLVRKCREKASRGFHVIHLERDREVASCLNLLTFFCLQCWTRQPLVWAKDTAAAFQKRGNYCASIVTAVNNTPETFYQRTETLFSNYIRVSAVETTFCQAYCYIWSVVST